MLRARRAQVGLTQEELAVRAGIGVRTVRDLERGHASRPQRTTVDLLADALGLTAADRIDFVAASRGQPAPAAALRRTRLPPATELIGRDADADTLVALLTGALPASSRGVTLVGLAGVGKTSLALAVAHRCGADLPGGVSGVVVTDVSTVADVLTGVAGAFGVGRPDDLAARLDGTPALLLFDAVERAPDAVVEALTLLLHRIPTLRFLATGRHPIGLPGERVWPLAPLVVPPMRAAEEPGHGEPGDRPGPTLDEVSGYPAVQLFLDRLTRVRGTAVEPADVMPLVTLVRRLGGLPLAIELAAARGRVLTIGEILDRYGDRVLDLAGSAARGSDDTVVSLRDAVAASYRLLAPTERYAVRLLSTFQSRWSLELAESMLDDGSSTDPVQLLDRLVELGLLNARGTGRFRFRLLDVVRDFAIERATAEGELAAARHRHAGVLADLAQRIAPELTGATLADAASRLDDVAGDLGAALGFAAAEDPRTALRIATALPDWWRFRGRDITGRRWLRRLVDDPRTADADPRLRAWALLGLAQLAVEHGEGVEEIASAEAALALFERLDEVPGQLAARRLLTELWATGGAQG